MPYREKIQPLKQWIRIIASGEKRGVGDVNIITSGDAEIKKLNRQFLGRDYSTDVIAFGEPESKDISGEIYISLDTVVENARKYQADVRNEWRRVVVHGMLHLAGHNDQSPEERDKMRSLEDYYLIRFPE